MRSITNILIVGLFTTLASAGILAQGLEFPGTTSREATGRTTRVARSGQSHRAKPPVSTPRVESAQHPKVEPQPSVAPEIPAQKAEPTAATPESSRIALPLKPEVQAGKAEMDSATPGISGLLFRTFGALLLIVGLIAAVGWGLRRAGLVKRKSGEEGDIALSVLNTLALGDKRVLQVVRFGDRTLLIGSTAQGITLLAERSDAVNEEYDELIGEFSDLIEDEPAGYFEGEMARASLLNDGWNGRNN